MQERLTQLIASYDNSIKLSLVDNTYMRYKNKIVIVGILPDNSYRIILFTKTFFLIWDRNMKLRRSRGTANDYRLTDEDYKWLMRSFIYYMNEIDERFYVFPVNCDFYGIIDSYY